jgi:hypothetical protein
MGKCMVVLAVPHQLQGRGFTGHIPDPTYSDLIEDWIAKGVDFIFEEAAGQTPSVASEIAESMLGAGYYMDVDPSPDERDAHGIARAAGGGEWLDPGNSLDKYEFGILEEQRKREVLWTKRILAQPFGKGLAICGLCHGLSLAFRLSDTGITVEKSYSYIPYHKIDNPTP